MGACASDAALDSSCSVAVILSLAGTDIVEYATCRSALVSDNARYMHSRTCHSQSKNISPLFVTELTVKTMRRYSLGFCEPQGKCNCIRKRNGLSGSVALRFVSCRRVAFRLLSRPPFWPPWPSPPWAPLPWAFPGPWALPSPGLPWAVPGPWGPPSMLVVGFVMHSSEIAVAAAWLVTRMDLQVLAESRVACSEIHMTSWLKHAPPPMGNEEFRIIAL